MARVAHLECLVYSKLTNDTPTNILVILVALPSLPGPVSLLSFNLLPAQALPWRVDSVNLPCRFKVESFLKVANAATILFERTP